MKLTCLFLSFFLFHAEHFFNLYVHVDLCLDKFVMFKIRIINRKRNKSTVISVCLNLL